MTVSEEVNFKSGIIFFLFQIDKRGCPGPAPVPYGLGLLTIAIADAIASGAVNLTCSGRREGSFPPLPSPTLGTPMVVTLEVANTAPARLHLNLLLINKLFR
ncbi:hypothetical protein EVAR_45262_1 [Eumeta japonica]|uniref:Uncharacterized protein n=1 Tax=Eumeta variegata TaxID=151549 RepID=A0A4C1XDH0_EUMVA|nr:hypothetical protein EVAR_45262_1 [Eumeta japonica]